MKHLIVTCHYFSLLTIAAAGLDQQWDKMSTPSKLRCETETISVVSLENIQGIFVVLAVGLAIATLGMIIEICMYTYRRAMNAQASLGDGLD